VRHESVFSRHATRRGAAGRGGPRRAAPSREQPPGLGNKKEKSGIHFNAKVWEPLPGCGGRARKELKIA